MTDRMNINADMGEGFGAYTIGADEELLDIVKTANIACGMHGGDATVMRSVAKMAAVRGVSIGAHPGFNDLYGFGRRRITMSASDLEYLVAYQIGALQAMATYTGVTVTHVKAHGALNNMATVDRTYASAIARAVKSVDPTLIHLVMPGTEMERATQEAQLPLGREAFVDRTYEDDGTLTSRDTAGSVLRDPNVAATRVVEMVKEQRIISRQGTVLPMGFDSLCVHGDEPSAVAVARATRTALEAAGITIVSLPEMLGR